MIVFFRVSTGTVTVFTRSWLSKFTLFTGRFKGKKTVKIISCLSQRWMRVRPQVPQAEAAAWGQVPRQCRGHRREHPGDIRLAGGPGGGWRSTPQQEERRRLRWHRRQAPEDLRWSHCRHGLDSRTDGLCNGDTEDSGQRRRMIKLSEAE